jgi:hypothetical protein
MMVDHRTEHSYHRKKWLKAQEVENMITVYDKDMTDKHEALVRLQVTAFFCLLDSFIIINEYQRNGWYGLG